MQVVVKKTSKDVKLNNSVEQLVMKFRGNIYLDSTLKPGSWFAKKIFSSSRAPSCLNEGKFLSLFRRRISFI